MRIAAGLYRRLRGGGGGHWLRGALRRTWAPALGLAIALGLAGLAMGAAAPEARTIGEFLHAG